MTLAFFPGLVLAPWHPIPCPLDFLDLTSKRSGRLTFHGQTETEIVFRHDMGILRKK